jgi:outer membrane protein assembly factor BamA
LALPLTPKITVNRSICLAAVVIAMLTCPRVATGQASPKQETPTDVAPATDIFDVWRAFRHHAAPASEPPWDYRKAMKAFAPVIGAKPSSGVLFGAAGNVAFYRGEPATTSISSIVTSLTLSSKGQISLTDRFTMFGHGNRWRLDGDHRFQWTSLETPGLGTSADQRDDVAADFDFFRLHHTAYYQLRPGLYAGGGFYFDTHVNIGPQHTDDEDAQAEWSESPFVKYSEANGFPLEAQASAGPSVDLLWDTRDNFINASRGWLAKASYRMSFDGLLGSDASWQRVNLDLRTYQPLSKSRRHTLAAWLFADLIVDGAAPYFDLPGTGLDTYGRSARGYGEGQFRGERLGYGELEYRGTLMKNGLLGMVAFVNATTISNLQQDEHLFDSVAVGGGAGLRLLINKRSKTNLCFDLGVGKNGARGIYLAVQEAF